MQKLLILACVALALVVTGRPSHAAERRPLPALVLADLGGAALEAPEVPDTGTWLLVYVRPACSACDALLDRMNSDERPTVRRIAIVVSGTPEAAQAIRGQYANLAGARWFLDADGSAATALAPPSIPAAFGVRDRTIEWTLAGPLRGGAELESVLFSWLERK